METTRKTVLHVDGMTCGSCVHHVRSALGDLEGVIRVDVRLREGKAIVEHGTQAPTVAAMVEALREAGYESSLEEQPAAA